MNTIESLLQSYFEGETSLQEEALLKDYFAQADSDDAMKRYAPLFACLRQSGEEELQNELFDRQFKERVTQIPVKKHHSIVYRIALWGSAAAASVAIIFGTIFYVERQNNYLIVNGKRVNDPEKAIMVAAQKLHLVTGSFNSSVARVQQFGQLNRHLSVLSVFNRDSSYVTDSLQDKKSDNEN